MRQADDETMTWNERPVRVSARLVPRFLWQTAAIAVTVGDQRVLDSGGVFAFRSAVAADFVQDGETHRVELAWGWASLNSFPVTLRIDAVTLPLKRVRIANWGLALWPLTPAAVYLAWRGVLACLA